MGTLFRAYAQSHGSYKACQKLSNKVLSTAGPYNETDSLMAWAIW